MIRTNSSEAIEKIKAVIEYTSYFLDARPQSRLKLLYSVDCETLNSLSEAEEEEEDDELDEVPPITYSASALRRKISKVNKGLGLYNRYYKMGSFVEGQALFYLEGPAAGAGFNLARYGWDFRPGKTSRMRQLYADLDDFLFGRKLKLPGTGALRGFTLDRIEKIEFYFTPEYELGKMLVYTEDCQLVPKKYGNQKLKPLKAKASWSDPTAVAYFAHMNEMITDLTGARADAVVRVPQKTYLPRDLQHYERRLFEH